MPTDSAASPTLIQSLQRGMRLVEAVAEQGPLTARALSERTRIVLPTTYHLLRTLVHEGYLSRSADGRYALGGQMTSVAQLESRARSLRLVRAAMGELAAQTRGDVTIGALRGTEVVITDFIAGPCPPRFECWPGMVIPGHATAIGKNILGRMSARQRAEYLSTHRLDALTTHTVTTNWRLEEELSEVGISHSDQQFHYGVACAATAVSGTGPLRALGVAYASNRTARALSRIDQLVSAAAEEIAAAIRLTDSRQDAGATPTDGVQVSA